MKNIAQQPLKRICPNPIEKKWEFPFGLNGLITRDGNTIDGTNLATLTCPALSISTVVSFYALTQDSIVLDNDIKGHDLS